MTVQELIDDLAEFPKGMPVKVMLTEVYGGYNDKGEFRDDMVIPLTTDDAIDADRARNQGAYILIISK